MDTDASNDSSIDCKSPSIVESVQNTSFKVLAPKKSRQQYEMIYNQFMNWRETRDIKSSFSENILMTYFGELSKKIKPTSLWTQYSMLRNTLSRHHDVDISEYLRLKALLKRKSMGYKPKRTKTLTSMEIDKFLSEAPDEKYLFTKVALVIGINGACSRQELYQLKVDDIEDLGSAALIKIPDIRTNKRRMFTITGEFYEIYKKYATLRPSNAYERRFFLNYQNGKCTVQPVGINKFGNIPKQIAGYLHLKDPELYTGHCFRRTSATIFYDPGRNYRNLRGRIHVDESLNKIEIANNMLQAVNDSPPSPMPSPTQGPFPSETVPEETKFEQHTLSHTINASSLTHPITFTNCHNNTITINFTSDVKK
jgi:integrase